MIPEYTSIHEDTKASIMSAPPSQGSNPQNGVAPSSVDHAANTGTGAKSLFPVAWRTLPAELADSYRILGDYAGALRAVADHPALDPSRKEARLKTVAQAIEGAEGLDAQDAAAWSALSLRHLLQSRGLDIQDPWQMLQAAGQDIHKSTYPDWSDLLAWCRFWAAPLGRMAFSLAGGSEQGLAKAESFAIAVEILHLVEQASTQHRWLGRVYLPARWFREAGCDPSELAGASTTEGLNRVFARAIDEAGKLLAASEGLHRHLPTRHLRIAAATAQGEAAAWARALGRTDPLRGVKRPDRTARLMVLLAGILRVLVR
jgi:phytoene/squalene synthetase